MPDAVPEPRRPSLSGYVDAFKLLPFSWVDARMELATSYWITTHAKGFPSSRPVWGLWDSPALLFSTGGQIGRNVARDERVEVHLESADEVVLIEGHAAPLTDASRLPFWVEGYRDKYNWEMPETTDGVYTVEPQRVLAWICDPTGLDAGAAFSNSATEWVF